MKTLLIGGARCGKSALALRWAAERATKVRALVTGTATDLEMAARITAHRRNRPAHWRVREEPVRLGRALREESAAAMSVTPRELVLVDCLTLWISNCLWPTSAVCPSAEVVPDTAGWQHERADFLRALTECESEVIIVTNEVGMGIVPAEPSARLFRDEHGWLNQAVSAACDEVFVVFAGLPLRLRPV